MGSEFDRFADTYDKTLKESIPAGLEEDEYFARYKVDFMARATRDRVVSRILDFGCGPGRSLAHLTQAFPQASVCGYDPSAESVRLAAERHPGARVTADWESLAGEAFDLIFVANVFHHIPRAEIASWLQRCGILLSAPGRIFVFEHNPWNPVTRHVFEHCPFDVDAKMIARPELIALGKQAGLDVAASAFTLFFPKPLKLLRPIERWLKWLPLGAQYCVEFERKD